LHGEDEVLPRTTYAGVEQPLQFPVDEHRQQQFDHARVATFDHAVLIPRSLITHAVGAERDAGFVAVGFHQPAYRIDVFVARRVDVGPQRAAVVVEREYQSAGTFKGSDGARRQAGIHGQQSAKRSP
jgi:hypothetical protein